MDRGELVDNHLTLSILRDHVRRALMAENCTGILIDGFPRELEQGILFEKASCMNVPSWGFYCAVSDDCCC